MDEEVGEELEVEAFAAWPLEVVVANEVVVVFHVHRAFEEPAFARRLGARIAEHGAIGKEHLVGECLLDDQLAKSQGTVGYVALDRLAETGDPLTPGLALGEVALGVAERELPVQGGVAIGGDLVHEL